MRFQSLILSTAIVSIVAIGTATAGDRFSTVSGLQAEPMTTAELAAVQGTHVVTHGTVRHGSPDALVHAWVHPKDGVIFIGTTGLGSPADGSGNKTIVVPPFAP